jgi:uncharacterized protein YdeI (YjbR/CyaY-like superfamily)
MARRNRPTDPAVDAYFANAPEWRAESAKLRTILLACAVDESLKWRKPCYAFEGRNLCILQPMKEFLALLFFKGALLNDPDGLLESQGENTRSALRLRFTDVGQVVRRRAAIQGFVAQAIEVEKKGLTVANDDGLHLVEELRKRLDRDPTLRAAFGALTPGRQREYNLYFARAKQSKTRAARVEKYVPKILAGKGFRDR